MSKKYKHIVDAVEQAMEDDTLDRRVIIENIIGARVDRRKNKELRVRYAIRYARGKLKELRGKRR